MKNVKIYLASFCVAVLALSCEKAVELNQPIDESVAPQLTTLTCKFPSLSDQNGTKVSLATTGKTQWEVGDKIVIYGNPSSSDATKRVVHEIVAADIDDPEVAVFDVDLSGLDAQYNSDPSTGTYYPYTVAYPYTDGQPYYLSTGNNNYGRARFQNTNQLLMAGHVSDDNSTIVLNHLTAALTFSVSGDFDSYTFSGANGTEVVGYSSFVVEMNRRSLGEGMYRQKYNNGGTTGDLTSIQGTVNGNGTAINYIYLPVNAQKSGDDYILDSQRFANVVYLPNGFTIKFFKGGELKKYITSSAALEIEPGHMINLGTLPAAALHDYVAPSTHDASHPAIAGATDLGASGTANCYIVDGSVEANKEKVFKFKAYKGNSATSVGDIASVSILWESYNNDQEVTANSVILEADFDKQAENDYYEICFKMPTTLHAGNAVIAAKNVGGDIIWSWHIWVPETTISQSTYGISTPEMMDRNLGALRIATASVKDIQAVGMLYQWGRKDPFPNKKVYSSSSNDYTSHATLSSASTDCMVESGLITLSYSIQHPTVFAGIDSGNTDWTSDEDNKYWDATKTMYDPCPPGYKVPAVSDTALLTEDITSCTGWAYNTGNCSFSAGLSDNYTVFPTGMLYQNGRFDEPLNKALIWSSKYESDHRAVGLYVKVEGAAVSTYKRSRANGGSVRCVAE